MNEGVIHYCLCAVLSMHAFQCVLWSLKKVNARRGIYECPSKQKPEHHQLTYHLFNGTELNLSCYTVCNLFFCRLLQCDEAPILYLLGKEKKVSLNNARLFLGIIDRKIAQMINNVQFIEPTTKILGKKDRVPNFNVRESAKGQK